MRSFEHTGQLPDRLQVILGTVLESNSAAILATGKREGEGLARDNIVLSVEEGGDGSGSADEGEDSSGVLHRDGFLGFVFLEVICKRVLYMRKGDIN